MPSRLTAAFDRAADVLNDSYAESDEFGDTLPLKYFDPRYPLVPPHEWQAIVGEETFQPIFDAVTQQTSIKRHCLADVRTPIVVASGVTRLQPDALFELRGEEWSLDEATSEWTEEFVTFGLVRKPLVHKHEMRSAAI